MFGDDCLSKFGDLDGVAAERNSEASVMIETDTVGTASLIDTYAIRDRVRRRAIRLEDIV